MYEVDLKHLDTYRYMLSVELFLVHAQDKVSLSLMHGPSSIKTTSSSVNVAYEHTNDCTMISRCARRVDVLSIGGVLLVD